MAADIDLMLFDMGFRIDFRDFLLFFIKSFQEHGCWLSRSANTLR